jgi:hypothetical protein
MNEASKTVRAAVPLDQNNPAHVRQVMREKARETAQIRQTIIERLQGRGDDAEPSMGELMTALLQVMEAQTWICQAFSFVGTKPSGGIVRPNVVVPGNFRG